LLPKLMAETAYLLLSPFHGDSAKNPCEVWPVLTCDDSMCSVAE